MSKLWVAAFVVGAGLVAGACGGGSDGGSAQARDENKVSAQGGATVRIAMRDDRFVPGNVTVSGTEIVLVNKGQSIHNFSIKGQGIDYDVQPGETEYEDVELPPGSYKFFCKYHEGAGMVGTLQVVSG